jgi:hypothetical protein
MGWGVCLWQLYRSEDYLFDLAVTSSVAIISTVSETRAKEGLGFPRFIAFLSLSHFFFYSPFVLISSFHLYSLLHLFLIYFLFIYFLA